MLKTKLQPVAATEITPPASTATPRVYGRHALFKPGTLPQPGRLADGPDHAGDGALPGHLAEVVMA